MTNVLLRCGEAVNNAGVAQHLCPRQLLRNGSQGTPVSPGRYRAKSPASDPTVLWMAHSPSPANNGKQSARDLFCLERHRLYTTPFATFEAKLVEQLADMFGEAAFWLASEQELRTRAQSPNSARSLVPRLDSGRQTFTARVGALGTSIFGSTRAANAGALTAQRGVSWPT